MREIWELGLVQNICTPCLKKPEDPFVGGLPGTEGTQTIYPANLKTFPKG